MGEGTVWVFWKGYNQLLEDFFIFWLIGMGEIPPLNRNKGKLVHTCFFSMFKKQHQVSLAMMVLGNMEKVDEGILLFPCLILESCLVVYLQFFLTFFYLECFFSFTNATFYCVFNFANFPNNISTFSVDILVSCYCIMSRIYIRKTSWEQDQIKDRHYPRNKHQRKSKCSKRQRSWELWGGGLLWYSQQGF